MVVVEDHTGEKEEGETVAAGAGVVEGEEAEGEAEGRADPVHEVIWERKQSKLR